MIKLQTSRLYFNLDTRTYLADKLTEMGRSDLQRLVLKKSNVTLPPIVKPSHQSSTLHAL